MMYTEDKYLLRTAMDVAVAFKIVIDAAYFMPASAQTIAQLM